MTLPSHASDRLLRLLAVAQRDFRVPSIAAGVTANGAPVWADAVGAVNGRADGEPADTHTQYRMGSITKPFIAVSVMKLRDAGRLSLNDPYERHVPGTKFGEATIAQLLSHSAGLQAETSGPWWERTPGGDWANLLESGVQQRVRAGRYFHYSNVGFGVLGQLLAVHHKCSWAEVIAKDIFAPLGLRRTTTRPDGKAAQGLAVHPFADVLIHEPEHDAGAMAPAGQLWTTVADLQTFAQFVATGCSDVISDDTLTEMFEPQHVYDVPGLPWTGAHGLGWQVWNTDGRRTVGHGGSMPGFVAGLVVDRAAQRGGVVLANSTTYRGPISLATQLMDEYAHQVLEPVTAWAAASPETVTESALELVGQWFWGADPVIARVQGDLLYLGDVAAGRGSRFRQSAPDRWEGLDGYHRGEPLLVMRDAQGAITHLDLQSFCYTRAPYDPACPVPGGVDAHGWH